MKRSAYLAGLAASIVTLSLASATGAAARVAAPPAATFNATIAAPSVVILGCCHTSIGLAPTEVVIPRIGRATVTGSLRWCGSSQFSPCPETAGWTLSLVFTTPSGDTLTLGGYSPTAFPWAVVDGTGRFAESSGSGQYTFNVTVGEDGSVTTITLSGTFRLRQ